MAKVEAVLKGDFNSLLNAFDATVRAKSSSASLEDQSDFINGDIRCSVRVYERYSYTGSNRVSLSITLFSSEFEKVYLSAITSGGSQALLFKMNTFGENAFLETIMEVINQYEYK